MDRPKIDAQTGMMERSVNIEDILEAKDIPSWGKPKGANLFDRISAGVKYV